jgi:hypothetical protein
MKSTRLAIYLNVCCALAVGLIGIGWDAARAQSAGGISLDVVGIRLGMTVKDAMLALKADNPRMTLSPFTREYEGLTGPLLFSVFGEEAPTPGGPYNLPLRAGENVEILFTVPPNQEVVWAVRRVYFFPGAQRPSLQNTLEALHRKYGPETLPADPDPRSYTKGIVWVYDGQGKPMGPAGQQIYKTCGTFGDHFGNGGLRDRGDIEGGGRPGPPECKSYIVLTASVQAGLDPASSQFVVNNVGAVLADGGRYRTAIEATSNVVLNAVKAREKKRTDEVNKRAAPKL